MNCQHNNFDDYFMRCEDCHAPLEQVVADEFKKELQELYKKIQNTLGIESGDIDALTSVKLEEAENNLATIVGGWISSAYEGTES